MKCVPSAKYTHDLEMNGVQREETQGAVQPREPSQSAPGKEKWAASTGRVNRETTITNKWNGRASEYLAADRDRIRATPAKDITTDRNNLIIDFTPSPDHVDFLTPFLLELEPFRLNTCDCNCSLLRSRFWMLVVLVGGLLSLRWLPSMHPI